MLVVADVNISQGEVDFLRELDVVERVVYVAQDLRRSMPDSEIVEYALENEALIVTRDKGFNYNPKKWKQDHPSVFIVRHKNRLVKEVGRQVKHGRQPDEGTGSDSSRRATRNTRRRWRCSNITPREEKPSPECCAGASSGLW